MGSSNPGAWLPEFIDTTNLDRLRPVHGAQVQPETSRALVELAKRLDISKADAARWAMEVGIAALYRERVIG